jgi:hypothetical protein
VALIVENGSGVADAESYASVAYCTTYHAARGNAAWASLASDAIREQCLRKATDYMVQVYRSSWRGFRKLTTQSLDFPRDSMLVDSGTQSYYLENTVVPTEVKNACAEFALKSSAEELYPDQERRVLEETVGPITTKYEPFSAQKKSYSAIEAMIAPYLNLQGVNVRLVK